jgi:hypothetical protein
LNLNINRVEDKLAWTKKEKSRKKIGEIRRKYPGFQTYVWFPLCNYVEKKQILIALAHHVFFWKEFREPERFFHLMQQSV